MSAKVIPFRTSLKHLVAAALATLTLEERLVISLRIFGRPKDKSA